MEIIQTKGFNHAIILLKILDDGKLLVVDKQTTIRFMDREKFSMLSGFKVNITHKYYKTSVVAFSNDGEYFATLTADAKASRLYNAKTKKLVTELNRHQGEVSCVGIDPFCRYMFSCGDDGKTFAIDMKSGKLIFTLPVHVDTVNDIAFSENGNWVATCSYDKKISLYSLVSMSPKAYLKGHSAAIIKMKFLTNHRLISVDKNSSAIIWNLKNGRIIERLQGIHDEIKQICTDKDDQFLFVGTALGHVLVYDLNTYEILEPRYIKITSAITAMEFDKEKNQLLIGSDDGFVYTYDIYEGLEQLKEYLKGKEFDLMQKKVVENPILKTTEIYKLIDNLWEVTLKKARVALQKQDKEKAMLLFKQFITVPSKKRIIQKTLQEYAEFPKFEKFVKEQKFALAYGLANAYPAYKESGLYRALEKKWKSDCQKAQKYVLNPKTVERAKEVFAPYRGISEKSKLMQELLIKGDIYKRFHIAMGQKDFVSCSELIKHHPFLKEVSEYELLMNYADSLYIKINAFIHDGDTHSAIKMLRTLSAFDDFKEEAKELAKGIDTKQKFFTAIENENYNIAYEMMGNMEELEDTKDGQILHNRWQEDQIKANECAVRGDAICAQKVLESYMSIRSKILAIATLYTLCYIVQIEEALDTGKPQHDIENGIKNYILYFGVIEHIENFFLEFKEKYPSTKLNLEQLKHGSLNMWRPTMIVESIFD